MSTTTEASSTRVDEGLGVVEIRLLVATWL